MQITIEVVYATVPLPWSTSLSVLLGTTVHQVLKKSGIETHFPELDIRDAPIGVFGVRKQLSDIVHAGDRIELYRSLQCDPKQMRRKKAQSL